VLLLSAALAKGRLNETHVTESMRYQETHAQCQLLLKTRKALTRGTRFQTFRGNLINFPLLMDIQEFPYKLQHSVG